MKDYDDNTKKGDDKNNKSAQGIRIRQEGRQQHCRMQPEEPKLPTEREVN
jgi:hypothetical protein